MTFAIPVNRIHETSTLLAFHHPRPSYPLHILLVPKRDIKSLTELAAADSDFLVDLFESVKMLVDQYHLEGPGYRLIANGGWYQEVPHLHFHLISNLNQEV